MSRSLDIESNDLYHRLVKIFGCTFDRYTGRSLVLGVICIGLAVVVGTARRAGVIPPSLRWAAALLPVLPMVGYFLGLNRWLRSLDELQRLIQLEALVVQLGLTSTVVMAYGLLAKFEVVPNPTIADFWHWIWLILFMSWAVGQVIVRRKYR
jgi:hypothetical protein